jgi:hypothetical protein
MVLSVMKDLDYAWKDLDGMFKSQGYESLGAASRSFENSQGIVRRPCCLGDKTMR